MYHLCEDALGRSTDAKRNGTLQLQLLQCTVKSFSSCIDALPLHKGHRVHPNVFDSQRQKNKTKHTNKNLKAALVLRTIIFTVAIVHTIHLLDIQWGPQF